MQNLTPEIVQQIVTQADELYEVFRMTTQNGAYEVIQTVLNDEYSYTVVQYRYDRDVNLADQSFALNNIVGGELFTNADAAKLRVMELLTRADFVA